MLRILAISGLFFLAAILEVSLFPNLFAQSIAPDVALVMIVILSARKKFENVWPWAVFSGIILDILTFGKIGSSVINFLIISFGIEFLAKRFFITQRSGAFLAIGIFVIAGTIISLAYKDFFLNVSEYISGRHPFSLFKTFQLNYWAIKIFSNLIILSIIYWPLIKLKNIFQINESKLIVR